MHRLFLNFDGSFEGILRGGFTRRVSGSIFGGFLCRFVLRFEYFA